MARVSPDADAHRARRQQLLAGVAHRLRAIGIEASFGVLERYYDLYGAIPEGVTGLVVHEPTGTGRMQVTVVGAHRRVPSGEGGYSGDGRTWVRDLDVRYDLEGDLVFELSTLEGRGDGPGHPAAI